MSSYRFDLDKAIAAWRRPFEHNRAFSNEDLEELEGSLRDRVEALMEAGLSEEAAFKEALRRMGTYGTAEEEYRKVFWGKLKRQRTLTDELRWRLSMLKNYVKIAVRNLLRRKGYSFINIAGLTLGLTCCLLIFQYVAFEYSFDRFNENGPNLYRILETRVQNGEEPEIRTQHGYALGPALAEAVPEVVRYTRLEPDDSNPIVSNPAQPGKAFEETRVLYADPAFLQIFTYPLLSGDPARALAEPGTVLLSESAARKYFAAANPVGQALNVTGRFSGETTSGEFRVSGVFQDVPANSHLQYDFLLPMADLLRKSYSEPEQGWNYSDFATYVQLRQDAEPADVERTFTDVLMSNKGESYQQRNITARLSAQPLHDIHLNGDITSPGIVSGSYRSVYFFSLIGIVTLLIALINYVNLATARALDRAREVGVRKVVGAQRGQLVLQFLLESALLNGVALALAAFLTLVLTPVVHDLAGTARLDTLWTSTSFWIAFLAIFCVGTLLAGLYPASILSSFRPATVLKGKAGPLATRLRLRQGLVVLQFTASIVLVAGTITVHSQLNYMRYMNLGIDLEQILTVAGPRVLPEGSERADAARAFTQELRRIPAVRQVASSSSLPGRGFDWYTSNVRQETADPSTAVSGAICWVDTSFASLYDLELVAGQDFQRISDARPEGEPFPVITNETGARAVGFDTPSDAVDRVVLIAGMEARIVGVFEDFNWSSAHTMRENAFFGLSNGNSHVSLKVDTQHLSQTIAAIERIYTSLYPGNPFRYAFADEQFDEQYRNDERFATLYSVFSGLAILIACLGLFGLASFNTQQRTKEIGLRKVLGASVTGIVARLSTDFLKLVGLSFILAAPAAYVGMSRWLDDFAYRIEIGPGVFVLTGVVVLLIALATVSYQTIKSALVDPVKSLRYE